MKRAHVYLVLGILSAVLGAVALVMGVVALFDGDTPRATLLWVGALICERDFRMRERQLRAIRTEMEREMITELCSVVPDLLTKGADRLDQTLANEDLIVRMRKVAIHLRASVTP